MSDNVTVDNGGLTDYSVSSDDAGAAGQVQRVKIAYSADGVATHATVDADGVLVNLGANNDVVVSDGGNVISVDDGAGSLTVDNAVISVVGGGAEATAQRVTIANDSTGVISVDDNGGSLTVDGTVAVTNAGITTIAGAVAGTEMQVDVLTMPTVTVDSELTTADLDTGAGTDTRAVIGLVGSKSGGGALIPGDATAGLKVDLGADNDVTVTSGSITATQGTAANLNMTEASAAAIKTSVEIMDDWDESDRAKVNPIVGQAGVQGASGAVSATTQRVVLATDVALPAGTNAIGKLSANSGVDIGDVDVTTVGTITPGTAATSLGKAEDVGHSSGDVGVMALAVRDTAPAANSNADGDYEVLHVSDEGGLWSAEVASSQGGTDAFFTYDCDETEEDVKTSAGTVYGWYIYNDNTSEVYVRLYNATAANTTVGSTAAKIVLPIPASSAANMAFTPGIKFDTAICIAATTGSGASDTAAPSANSVIATVFYK